MVLGIVFTIFSMRPLGAVAVAIIIYIRACRRGPVALGDPKNPHGLGCINNLNTAP